MSDKELLAEIENYVGVNIAKFHESRIEKLNQLKLDGLVKRKNPYLYKAMNLNTPGKVVESIAAAFMSSAEESMFGDWLEGLAIHIARIVFGGYKSSAEGMDLEMDKDGIHYFISVKSGPNWSNSSSLKKLKENFAKAIRIYRTSNNKVPCEAIEGCCYGRENNQQKEGHKKLCGQEFWFFISGCQSLYVDIIEPLGKGALEKNEQYQNEYCKMISRFTKSFIDDFCLESGEIDWPKIVEYNSGR